MRGITAGRIIATKTANGSSGAKQTKAHGDERRARLIIVASSTIGTRNNHHLPVLIISRQQ